MEDAIWKALNFIFCERCGCPVPNKHGKCHTDVICEHNGAILSFGGGWHDAGDMSQQMLQTAEVAQEILELASRVKDDPLLYHRLMEEGLWGLEFTLKSRFGDGFRASSVGLGIWTEGLIGDGDDVKTRVHNQAFQNFFCAAVEAQAATGSVYTCTINRCYAHPVTGAVEDSGGAGSYATGQGMVEGCVYPTGILEVADDGNYYLTIRLSLMDYTSGHDFQVQSVGDSGWSSTGYAQTGTGSDSNGTTADVVIQVPSENCIVRGTMYVEPMGRNVVFYLYPSDYKEGNNTDMNATMVTGSAASDGTAAESSSNGGRQYLVLQAA